MANFKKRIKAIESRAAALTVGMLPDLPKPYAEMTLEELQDWTDNFI